MLTVEISDTTVNHRTAGEFTFHEQSAFVFFYGNDGKQDPHPQKVVVQLQEKQEPWPVGSYILSPQSLYRNRYGQITLGRVVLVPKSQGLKAAA